MKNNPDIEIQCDICKQYKKGNEIFHYSAYINGELFNHIHICEQCFKILNLKLVDITKLNQLNI